jgi:ATP-dependent helicase/nuclease subunit A
MVMAARPPVGAQSDLLFEFLRCQRRDAADLEAQRLLYVACTRAKRQLRLTATTGCEEEPEEPEDESFVRKTWAPTAGSLLAVLWPIVGGEFESQISNTESQAATAVSNAPRGGPLRRLPAHFSQDIASATAAVESMSALPVNREETPIFDWAGETARRVGSLVHAELQAMDISRIDERAIRARQGHFSRWLALHGVPADRLEPATARVIDALLAVHRDPRGRWILSSGYRDDFREHALSGQWQGELVRVVFDRSFIDAETRWVIDYKTSQHQGSGQEQFLDREVDRYRPQLQRYAGLARKLGPEPVRLGLYFPLMRAWREWSA